MNTDLWCMACRKRHEANEKCVACEFGPYLHEPVSPSLYIDYRGWRWTAPFICMGCGDEVCHHQWAFSRTCGACDVSHSPTRRRLPTLCCFGGKREKLPTWNADNADIEESRFLDPAEKAKYPLECPRYDDPETLYVTGL